MEVEPLIAVRLFYYIIARRAGVVKGQLQKRWLPIVSTVGRDDMNLFEVLAGL